MPLPINTAIIDDESGYALPPSNTTWETFANVVTWSGWKSWNSTPANAMTVVSTVQDREKIGYFNLKTTADVTGNIAYSVYTSNTGAFAGEETISNISPNTGNIAAFYGRYYTVVANVSDPSGQIQLRSLDITSIDSRFDIQFNDVDTSSLASGPNNAGSRVLPLPRTISAVTNMQVTAHNPSQQNSIYITTGNTGYVLDYNSTISTVTTAITAAVPTYVNYIMVATKEAPYNYIFKTTNGDTWANLTVVSNAGGSYGESVAWNHDSTRVAFGLESPTTNNLRVYNRSGDTFTKAGDVNTWPAGGVHDVAWTNTDDDFLVVAHDNSPYISIYAGSNYNKLSNPSTIPAGSAFAVKFSPNDDFLAVGVNTNPYIEVYTRSGNTFTKLANFISPNLINAIPISLSWSPDSTYLAVGHEAGLSIYYRSGNTFSLISNPAIVPQATGFFCLDWNSSGNAVAVGWTGPLTDTAYTTDFGIYRTSGNVWTWANSAATTIASTGSLGVFDIEWIDGTSGTQLAVAHHNADTAGRGMSIYNMNYSTDTLTLTTGFSSNVGNVYAVGSSEAVFNNFLPVASVAGFPASGNIRVRNETMSYTSANAVSNTFEGITRAVTTQTFGTSTANVHAAGSEVFAVNSIDFTQRYFSTEAVGIANAYVDEKDRTLPTVVVRDGDGQYTDGVIDALLYVLPEQYMDNTNLGTR
jgi:hypothetical protein